MLPPVVLQSHSNYRPEQVPPRWRSRAFLVVDDDSQILRAVRTTLLARGYAVGTASSGETALSMLKEDVWTWSSSISACRGSAGMR